MVRILNLSASVFHSFGNELIRNTPGISAFVARRRFRALFGVSPLICSIIWNIIGDKIPHWASPNHLLWALMFLKVYGSEQTNKIISGADEKTFRKWTWAFVDLISNIRVSKWEKRLVQNSILESCYVSVDGTDPEYLNQGHLARNGTHTSSRDLVYDVTIFRSSMKKELINGEKVIADGGYPDGRCVTSTDVEGAERRHHSIIRARHETANGRFKSFFALGHRFRHDISRHSSCFHAVANITQLMIEHGEPLFAVESS